MGNLITAFHDQVQQALAKAPPSSSPFLWTPSPVVPPFIEAELRLEAIPDEMAKRPRKARRCAPPTLDQGDDYIDLDTARAEMYQVMRDYLMEPNPGYTLLITSKAGVGKTTVANDIAHWAHKELEARVMYFGPRHNFFEDIVEASVTNNQPPWLWHEWLPRQKDQEDPARDTCRYAPEANAYAAKGYPTDHFCQQACGKPYMRNQCPYLRQAKSEKPLIFAQHAHLTAGNPLAEKMTFLIGDENPGSAFTHVIDIPADRLHWGDLDPTEELAEVIFNMETAAREGKTLKGMPLMEYLDMDSVLRACQDYPKEKLDKLKMPRIRKPQDALELPFNVLHILVPLLEREALAAIEQRATQKNNPNEEEEKREVTTYISRIEIHDKKLTLYTRKEIAKSMPTHIIWLDATGNDTIYTQMFERRVERYEPKLRLNATVTQVTDRSNPKSSLMRRTQLETDDGEEPTTIDQPTEQSHQLRMQIEHIVAQGHYKDPAIIVPKSLREYLGANGHFYANRGTNHYAKADAIIIAGTPMPPIYEIENMAKCLWFDEMKKFDNTWMQVDTPYQYIDPKDGLGWCYPTMQFADERLTALLWQHREAEIIQSAHRARILTRDVPVYLLTNLPIAELPPTRLVTLRNLMGTPDNVHIFQWQAVIDFAEAKADANGVVTLSDFVNEFGVSKPTAIKYMDNLVSSGLWEQALARKEQAGRGRPPRAISPMDL